MRVHHIALRTADVPRLEAFYRDLLGLPVTARPGGSRVWLAAGETLLMLEPREPDEPTVPAGSMEFLAFAITPAERTGFVARLAQAGVTVEAQTDFTLYFRDPDGRRVGVSHHPDRPPGTP